MHIRPALFTVVIVIAQQLILRCETHAKPVLPNFAGFALNHELACIGIILWETNKHETKGCGDKTWN